MCDSDRPVVPIEDAHSCTHYTIVTTFSPYMELMHMEYSLMNKFTYNTIPEAATPVRLYF